MYRRHSPRLSRPAFLLPEWWGGLLVPGARLPDLLLTIFGPGGSGIAGMKCWLH